MDKTNYALESFKNIQELIRFADQKAGAILIIAGLTFTGYIQYLSKVKFAGISDVGLLGILIFFASAATIISMIIVFYLVIFEVLKPRTASKNKKGELSTFYYEHLMEMDKTDLFHKVNGMKEGDMLKDILDQQVEVASILHKKTSTISSAFMWLFVSLISSIIFFILTNQL